MLSIKTDGAYDTRKILSFALPIVMLVVVALLPSMFDLGHTLILLSTMMMYIILSVSWSIFSGPTGYVSLATAAFFGSGIYTAALLVDKLPLPLLLLAGGATSFIVAVIVGAVTLRLRGVYFTIFSFALVKLLDSVILYTVLRTAKTKGQFVNLMVTDENMKRTFMKPDQLNSIIYYALVIMMALVLICAFVIKHSKHGKALTAIGESEDAAAHVGINTTVVKVSTFAISAFWAGAVGALWALRFGYIDPTIAFNQIMSFTPILMAIFGGLSVLPGPVVGAVVFTYITEKLNTTLPDFSMLGTGIVMVGSILFLPNGIVGLIQKLINRIRHGKPAQQPQSGDGGEAGDGGADSADTES